MDPKKVSVAMMALVVAMVLVSLAPAFGQVDTAWVRRYNGPGNDEDNAQAVAVDTCGNAHVTGWSWNGTDYDYATIKYYPNGDTAWIIRYEGPGGGDDYAYDVAVVGCDYVYVTGSSGTLKYTGYGSLLWVNSFSGVALEVDNLGNVYVTGPDGTAKIAVNPDESWVREWGGVDIVVDPTHNVYVTGGDMDYETIKYYANGDVAWLRTYDGPAGFWDRASAIAVDGYDNAYVTGESWSMSYGDYATIKYAPNGDTLWVKRYDRGVGQDSASAIAVDASGNVYVTGHGYSMLWMNTAYVTIRYDTNGDFRWSSVFEIDIGTSKAYALALDSSSNVYVTGASNVWGTSYDYATIKYDSSGNWIWTERYNGPGNDIDVANDVAVDASKNVFVTGASYGSGTGLDYATIKYIQFSYMPGDVNNDWLVDLEDVLYLINYLYQGGPEPQPELCVGEVNGQDPVDLGDLLYLISYLYKGGSPPSDGCD